MNDYYRNAITQLLKSGYDIFLPLQHLIGDELVISDGSILTRCLIKKVAATQQGPMLSTTIKRQNQKMIVDGLSIEYILASWLLNEQAWLIPVQAILGMQSVRLSNRPDWLVQPIKRFDAPTRIDLHPSIAKELKEQGKGEEKIRVEADVERKYFDSLLRDSNEGD